MIECRVQELTLLHTHCPCGGYTPVAGAKVEIGLLLAGRKRDMGVK